MKNENRANVAVLIPAYEPPADFPEYVKTLIAEGFPEIIVVNDGSGIEYEAVFEAVRALGVSVIDHPENRGKGCAMRTGLSEYSRLYGGKRDGVVTVNSDGIDRIQDIKKAAELLAADVRKGKTRLILGARDLESPYLTKGSRRGNKFTSFIFKYLSSESRSRTRWRDFAAYRTGGSQEASPFSRSPTPTTSRSS